MKRITAEDINLHGVINAPDKLQGTAQENKMIFDRLIREVVAGAINAVIDKFEEFQGTEESRDEAEQERQRAEEARQEAETQRQNTFAEEVEQAREYKEGAEAAANRVGQTASDSEAWATGQRNGADVSSLDPAYRNNAKFYKDQAKAITSGNDVFVFRNITVKASEWMASTKHQDFPWEATTSVKDVTENHVPFVTFDHIDSATYGLGTVADTGDKTLTIYAVEKPGEDLVIPQVVFIEEGVNADKKYDLEIETLYDTWTDITPGDSRNFLIKSGSYEDVYQKLNASRHPNVIMYDRYVPSGGLSDGSIQKASNVHVSGRNTISMQFTFAPYGGWHNGAVTVVLEIRRGQESVTVRYVSKAAGIERAMPEGGTAGQVLKKRSDENYDAEWGEASGSANGVGHGLKLVKNKDGGEDLTVDSVSDFEGDNTLPASAVLVQNTVGNIETLLSTI